MKHGPRCLGCRVSMILEHESDGDYHVCPQCGHAEPAESKLEARSSKIEPERAHTLFEEMRRAVQ